ncbi:MULTISPECIES: hypothetical protein [Natrialbaceae]|uniref:hypothetical protein n=1 Tax=Natrialbaceae TaxID=1644061 RepID=UPI00207CB515|nr:hypothetical protein [Natronococcus sp. CG52]
MTLHRRNLLKLTGATAAAAVGTTAGCLETVGLEDGGEVPAYANWLHLDADGDVVFAYVDRGALESLDEPDPEEDEDPDDWGDDEDAMIAYPMLGAFVGIMGAGFGLWGTGLMGLVQSEGDDADDEDGSTAGDFETNVAEILWVNDAIVLAGEIDTEEIDAELTTVPDDDFFASEYERTGEIGDFERYEPSDEDAMGPAVIAVSEDAIVFAGDDEDVDTEELIRGPIEAREGDTAADAEPDVEWLLEEAGHGQLVFGGYVSDGDDADNANDPADDEEAADDAEFDQFERATGICSSLDLEDDGATGAFAALGDDLTADESELEGALGSSAAEATIDVDDDRITASATWEEDVTDEQA